MNPALDAAVLVVTFNHVHCIVPTLRAMLALDPPPRELLVLDNASRDGTADLVRAQFPAVRLIEAGANLGFAGACNLGARATIAATIVLANPDLLPRRDWLEQLLAPLGRSESVGVVGCKLLYPDGRVQHAGGLLALPTALGQHCGVGEADQGQFNLLTAVDFVTGAALATPRRVWDAVEGMDAAFAPAYYEDADYCTRVRRAGFEVLYTPQAVAVHHEGAGLSVGSERYLRLYHLNRLRYIFKYFNDVWLLRTWLPAELSHIRAVATDGELSALSAAYLSWQSVFCGTELRAAISDLDVFPDATAAGGETELQWVTRQVAAKATVQLRPQTSRWPLVAWLRTTLLRIVAGDVLRDSVQQQNDANQALLEAIQALGRQRRATDAAVLAQGMLLAKIFAAAQDQLT